MKKKGFTLIELLATIVILSVIALIAVPIVINVIDDAVNQSTVSGKFQNESVNTSAAKAFINTFKDKSRA